MKITREIAVRVVGQLQNTVTFLVTVLEKISTHTKKNSLKYYLNLLFTLFVYHGNAQLTSLEYFADSDIDLIGPLTFHSVWRIIF